MINVDLYVFLWDRTATGPIGTETSVNSLWHLKILEFSDEAYDHPFKFCVLVFIYIILIVKHFDRTVRLRRGDTGLILQCWWFCDEHTDL